VVGVQRGGERASLLAGEGVSMKPKDATADPLSRLLDAATEGLAGDAELRLDVRAELATHIEEKREELGAKGHNDNEALDLALKSFGPATDLAAELVEANRRRMKLRALARVTIRAGAVPAAVVVALLICVPTALRHQRWVWDYVGMAGSIASSDVGGTRPSWIGLLFPAPTWGYPFDEFADRAVDGLPPEHAFLFRGDGSRATPAARQRAIWEAHPESKVYYGNYATHLCAEDVDLDFFEREVRRGEELDPGNGRYNYLLAGTMLERASKWETPAAGGRGELKLVVEDRELLDRAMAELLKAGAKPYARTYWRHMVEERLALLPPARSVEEHGARTTVVASVLMRDLALRRSLARVVPHYARLLAAEGRREEATEILGAWYPMLAKAAEDSYTLIELLAICGVADMVADKFPGGYEQLGDHEKAEETRRRARMIAEPIIRRRADRGRSTRPMPQNRELWRRGGSYAAMLTPALFPGFTDPPDDASLAPGRGLEQVVLEQSTLSLVLTALLVLMLGAWVVSERSRPAPVLLFRSWEAAARVLGLGVLLPLLAFYVALRWIGLAGGGGSHGHPWLRLVAELLALLLLGALIASKRWRTAREASSPPILLLPSWRTAARILGLGVLLPLLTFYVYTRLSGLAGRECSVYHLWPRFLLELVLLTVTILAATISAARRAIRERCGSLGVPVPERTGRDYRAVLWIALGALWATCLALRGEYTATPAAIGATLVIAFAIGYGIALFVRLRFGPERHALYYGTLARSLVPVFAAAAILVAAVAHPYLARSEAGLVRVDPFMAVEPGTLSEIEADVFRRLKAEIKAAILEVDSEIEAEKAEPSPRGGGAGDADAR